MAFFTPSWMTFWKTHGVKTMPTGRATPWPNRAETAVRLFKRQYEKLLMDASVHPTLSKVTLRDLIRECCWDRNTTLTISGYTPVELATGRRPTDHSDLELMKPDQLSAVDLPRDATLNELRKLALKAHLEARQSADLRRDLARRVLPSDGPYAHGDRVFVWIDDKAKYKAVGRWARARVISQNEAIVTVETDKAVLKVNQSKVRRAMTHGMMCHCREPSTSLRRKSRWSPMTSLRIWKNRRAQLTRLPTMCRTSRSL